MTFDSSCRDTRALRLSRGESADATPLLDGVHRLKFTEPGFQQKRSTTRRRDEAIRPEDGSAQRSCLARSYFRTPEDPPQNQSIDSNVKTHTQQKQSPHREQSTHSPNAPRPEVVEEVLLRQLAGRKRCQLSPHLRKHCSAGLEDEEARVYIRGRLRLPPRKSPGVLHRVELAVGSAADPGVVGPTDAEAVLDA